VQVILRRVIAHFRNQEWTAIFLDFLIVVLGVFVGLQVNNWNEDRADQLRAETYMERIRFDFQLISDRLESNITEFDTALQSVEYLRNEIDRLALLTEEQAAEFRSALNDIDASSIPAWRSATYTEMQSAGVLDLIDNAALKQALVDYDQGAVIAHTAWGTLIGRQIEFVEPILFSLIEYGPQVNVSKGTDVINVVRFDYERMKSGADFRAALSALARTQSNNRVLQANQLALARQVLANFPKEEVE
jgi:hypothetical protein